MPSSSQSRESHRSDAGHDPVRIAVAPDSAPSWMADAVVAGGGQVVPVAEAEALVWGAPLQPQRLAELMEDAGHLRWVQLPFAGIEGYLDHVDNARQWTCGKGV